MVARFASLDEPLRQILVRLRDGFTFAGRGRRRQEEGRGWFRKAHTWIDLPAEHERRFNLDTLRCANAQAQPRVTVTQARNMPAI